MATGTLDADAETFSFTLSPGQRAAVTLDIAATITVTATSNGAGFSQPNGNAAAWTADAHFEIDVPGAYTFTASGTSGGSCVYRYVIYGAISG